MKAVLWKKGEALGQYSVDDRVAFSRGVDPVVFPVVMDGDEVVSMQAWDFNNHDKEWVSGDTALTWATTLATSMEKALADAPEVNLQPHDLLEIK